MLFATVHRNLSQKKLCILALFFPYIVYLLIITLSPFEFSISRFQAFLSTDFSKVLGLILSFDFQDIIVNIVLFIPLGMILFQMIRVHLIRLDIKKWIIPIATGLIVSGMVEIAQLFLDRSSTVIDLAANTGGTCLGFYGSKRLIFVWQRILSKLSRQSKWILHFSAVLCYGILFSGLMFLPTWMNHLETWNDGYHLYIGNEATMDRPWEGTLFLVALYNRALRMSEIQSLYKLGIGNHALTDRKSNRHLIALYTFEECTEDTVHDLSDWGKPLHLFVKGANWLEETTGMEIEEGVLKSITPARKIVEAIHESSQMTVEVWMVTDNLVQSGPARIVSLSDGHDHRNFTLGQVGKDVHFRVSTSRTGPNGSRIQLIVPSVLNDLQKHHVVATFNRGVERLIVDGSSVGDILRGDMDYLPDLFGLGRNSIAKSAFCFVFIFPLSFLAYGLFRKNNLLFTLIAVMGLVMIIEMIYYTKFGQPFGYVFFFISFFTTLSGCLVGYVLKRN